MPSASSRPSRRLSPRHLLVLACAILLGAAAAPVAPTSRVAAATPLPAVVDVSVGVYTTCAVLADGTVRCWGQNDFGQLGNGTILDSIVPSPVRGITAAVKVSVSPSSACALLADGTIRCWGDNQDGQLGDGTTTDRLTPVTVHGITTAVEVSAGNHFACARLASGAVRCWGTNSYGQIGDGTTTQRLLPRTVTGLVAVDITTGYNWACGVLAGGTAMCWGSNLDWNLGTGDPDTDRSSTPVAVTGMTTATAISAGTVHTCALLGDGTATCWGRDRHGEAGGTGDTATPRVVSGVTGAVEVAAGGTMTCARLGDGSGACWGDDEQGALGNGDDPITTQPVVVSGLTGATRLASGDLSSCAILGDASLVCWGGNWAGQLGDRTVEDRPAPVPVRWDADTVDPTATRPVFNIPTTPRAGPKRIYVTVRWTGADDAAGTGIDHYQVQKSRDGGATWATISNQSAASRTVWALASGSMRYRVRPYDRAGNAGPWATSEVIKPRFVQQTSSAITWHDAWTTRYDEDYLGGSVRYTKAAGPSATYRFTGTAIAFVTTGSPTRGVVEVFVDGASVGTLNLNLAYPRYRNIAWERHWTTRGTHTIRLVAAGTPGTPRVDVDAFLVLK